MSQESNNDGGNRIRPQNNRLLKVHTVVRLENSNGCRGNVKQNLFFQSIDTRSDPRPCVSKSNSFGGYGGPIQSNSLLRGDSITSTKSANGRLFTKQDSTQSTSWRLSPSSSG